MAWFHSRFDTKLSLHECGHCEYTVLYNSGALYSTNWKAYFELEFSQFEADRWNSCDKIKGGKGGFQHTLSSQSMIFEDSVFKMNLC